MTLKLQFFSFCLSFASALKRLPFIFLLLVAFVLKSQDSTSSRNSGLHKGFQVNLFPGFLIAHREYMANMEAHAFGFEIIYSSNTTGWRQADEGYRHLRWGTGLTYFNLGNKNLNGEVYAWHIHVEANLKKREHFQSVIRFGSGVGYLTKPYNMTNNRKNKAIGSKLNGNMQLLYKAYFDLTKRTSLVLGLGVTHYSNGNFKRPNLGINIMHLNMGISQKFNFARPAITRTLPELFPRNGFEILAAYANKEISVADTRRFNIFSTSLLYYFRHNTTRNWRVGTEVFFDKTYPYSLFQPSTLQNVKLAKMTEIAIKAGHEFIFGRLAIVTDLGTYVYRPNQYKKRVYFAIGFNYFFNRGVVLQTRLKSHMAVADYFYWGAGYRFSDKFLRGK
jgi:hypothetical protein